MFDLKDKPKKMPTSRIIYDLTFPNNTNNKESDLENVLFERLEKLYKLDTNTANKFIDNEVKKINERGSNIDNYVFGNIKTVEEALKIFYSSQNGFNTTPAIAYNFNDITFSELAMFSRLFQAGMIWLVFRELKLQKIKKKEYNKDKTEALIKQINDTENLINYYKYRMEYMRSKMASLLDYRELSDDEKGVLAQKELKYLKKQIKTLPDIFKEYRDLSIDAVSKHDNMLESFKEEIQEHKNTKKR